MFGVLVSRFLGLARCWNIWSRSSIWSLRNSWKLKEIVSSRWYPSSWLFRKTESRVSSCCTRGGLSGWSGWQSCLVWSGFHIDSWSSLIRCAHAWSNLWAPWVPFTPALRVLQYLTIFPFTVNLNGQAIGPKCSIFWLVGFPKETLDTFTINLYHIDSSDCQHEQSCLFEESFNKFADFKNLGE